MELNWNPTPRGSNIKKKKEVTFAFPLMYKKTC